MEEIDDVEFDSPVMRLVIPSDVVPVSSSDDSVYIIGTQMEKVTKIAGLEVAKDSLETLTLRCCLISTMEGVESLTKLRKLELYDNQIQRVSSLESLHNLQILDMSFNAVRDMSPVSCCPNLTELYLAQNKLRKIQGIAHMKNLRILDLGANRIRVCLFPDHNT
jgi:Leucine-rich repeat (LRR) protein